MALQSVTMPAVGRQSGTPHDGEFDAIHIPGHPQTYISATKGRVPPGHIAGDEILRSEFVRRLILSTSSHPASALLPARLIVQFWDEASAVPLDVQACLDSWAPLEQVGFRRLLFDDASALRFIEENFTARHVLAFRGCGHPAMRADYFRLSFMVRVGGLYVDADDRYTGQPINSITEVGHLQLQPLCYDIPTDSMLNPYKAAAAGEDSTRIFYVNNNPLIAPAGHPLVVRALERATDQVLSAGANDRDVQSITGPGNLTSCLVEHVLELRAQGDHLDCTLLPDWDATAVSMWPLGYRSDDRNWRKWVHK